MNDLYKLQLFVFLFRLEYVRYSTNPEYNYNMP